MEKQITITIIGVGAVGGFYGALLAHYYANNPYVRICFVCRSENLKQIKSHGLILKNKDQELISFPDIVTDNPQEIGYSDYVIVATKAYDLSSSMLEYSSLIGPKTVVLPLLNGILPHEILKQLFKESIVLQGCTYIVSRLTQPGLVENPSGRQRMVIGGHPKAIKLASLLSLAGIEISVADDISSEVWKKYLLVSSSALLTTYYNSNFGEIVTRYKEELVLLLQEATQIARGLKVELLENIIEVTLGKITAVPGHSTTSMHSDFLSKKDVNELELMAGYISDKACELGIEVPTYNKMYNFLKQRSPIDYPF